MRTIRPLSKENLLDLALDELAECQSKVLRIEQLLRRIKGENLHDLVPPAYMQRLKVWHEIQKRGGTVTEDELYSIAKIVGYDRRGLGGFFTGKGSLNRIHKGKIALSDWASKEVERYKEALTGKGGDNEK